MPTMPERSTCAPALTPWLYSGELGAFAVVMICRGMTVLPGLYPYQHATAGSQVSLLCLLVWFARNARARLLCSLRAVPVSSYATPAPRTTVAYRDRSVPLQRDS